MKKVFSMLGILLLPSILMSADEVVVKRSEWNGYERQDFVVDGRKCLLVIPKTPAQGKPWAWRTEFFGHEPQGDIALLGKGFHIAYMDVQNMYGAPVALDHMDKFYAYLTKERGLSSKTVPEGFSRGGLFAFNWAARNPDKVAALYVDAPVCDFKSWPGGKGKGKGSTADWERCKKIYGLTEEQAMAYKLNPVDNLEPLAKAKIPILSVCGETDKVVPIDENSRIIKERYEKLGGTITLIAKPFCDHHPHSMKDPAKIVNFILRATPGFDQSAMVEEKTPYGYDYFRIRDGLMNCRIRFEREKNARVAFLGGSITAGGGWRDLVCENLKQRFPQTEFDFIAAGISSLGSTPHSFRFTRDVLMNGPVDLLFVEAAVNDETNGQTPVEMVRGMEGVVRQARISNPKMDIIMLQFVDPDKMKVINEGKIPVVIECHEKVAEYYAVPSIDLAKEVTERIYAGEFTWEKDFKNLHPSPFGHALYLKSIKRLFDEAWKQPLTGDCALKDCKLPEKPLDEKSYFRGKLVDLKQAVLGEGWAVIPDWKPSDKAGTRKGFVNVPALVSEKPGSTLKLKFEGTAVGIFVAAGPDAGTVEYSIDGGPFASRNLFTQWSGGLHLPWAQVLNAELASGQHEMVLKVSKDADPKSKGNAVRIIHLLVN
ncbi:MAG: GDSL-type esterase/lipase family protein [Kiritimatiellae bacterium]|nr:GDSL-type esterase/lipase family protein [Kiritimatiellia bacterium]MDD5522974.1 GDSL-type esterase/lipase family protein [Kiritimatiellia bacterium]